MKYCTHCGKELLDEAMICPGCGCEVSMQKSDTVDKEPAKKSRRKIILIIIAAISAIALLVAGYFVYNYVRADRVIEDLSGQNFTYFDIQSYPFLGESNYTSKEMDFDENGMLMYSYYYSNIDAGDEYQMEYKVRFKGDMIILEMGIDEYEVLYDKYGRISGIYDIAYDELYE